MAIEDVTERVNREVTSGMDDAKAGVVRRIKDGVRLLGSGELTTKVELSVHSASASARKAIEAAGGKLTTKIAAAEPAEAPAEA